MTACLLAYLLPHNNIMSGTPSSISVLIHIVLCLSIYRTPTPRGRRREYKCGFLISVQVSSVHKSHTGGSCTDDWTCNCRVGRQTDRQATDTRPPDRPFPVIIPFHRLYIEHSCHRFIIQSGISFCRRHIYLLNNKCSTAIERLPPRKTQGSLYHKEHVVDDRKTRDVQSRS